MRPRSCFIQQRLTALPSPFVRYLKTCSFGSRSDVRTLTVRDVVDLSEQVTQALLYLHVQGICHTDVAARNCW